MGVSATLFCLLEWYAFCIEIMGQGRKRYLCFFFVFFCSGGGGEGKNIYVGLYVFVGVLVQYIGGIHSHSLGVVC